MMSRCTWALLWPLDGWLVKLAQGWALPFVVEPAGGHHRHYSILLTTRDPRVLTLPVDPPTGTASAPASAFGACSSAGFFSAPPFDPLRPALASVSAGRSFRGEA